MFGIELTVGNVVAAIAAIFAILGAFGVSFKKYEKALGVGIAGLSLAVHTLIALKDRVITDEEKETWKLLRQELIDAINAYKEKPSADKEAALVHLMEQAENL